MIVAKKYDLGKTFLALLGTAAAVVLVLGIFAAISNGAFRRIDWK